MESREPYLVCVVGAGMIGSAAARHLSERHGSNILLIGPDELQDASNTDIFGSHYDEGRITSVLEPKHAWGVLAQRSIERYRQIEHQSDIPFYSEVGFLLVGAEGRKYYLKIGHDSGPGRGPQSSGDIRAWFQSSGDVPLAHQMLRVMTDIIPGLAVLGWETHTCIITHTKTGRIYVDMVSPEIGVATGGCGRAAMSSDEIGKMAAMMIEERKWTYSELPAELFKCQYKKPESQL